jgi:hypothetical protein
MSLQGLPDFFQPIMATGYAIYYPYENAGNFCVAPVSLEVGNRLDGCPDFLLELVRGEDPSLDPWGVMDFRLQPRYEMADALVQVRSRQPEAMVAPLLFSSGFLRLLPSESTTDIPDDLKAPMPLTWNGLGNVRFSLNKLSTSTATLIKGALQGEYLPLSACAEMEVLGVAPRLHLHVRFDPAQLLTALSGLGDQAQYIARPDIVSFFRQAPSHLPLAIVGEVSDVEAFAETMTDWVRSYWGAFVPSPRLDGQPYLRLVPLDTIGSGQMEWDLSQPLQAFRPLSLYLNPLKAVKEAIAHYGLDALIHYKVISTLSTGMLPVTIFANLPTHRQNVEKIGVTLKAAPFLPHRPQAAISTVEFNPPEDKEIANLRLSPIEPPEYTATTYALIGDSRRIRKFKGVEKPCRGNTVYLSPDDFPVKFITIEAFQNLLELSSLQGTCHWQEAGETIEQTFELNQDRSLVGLVLPQGIDGATLGITACSLQSDNTLSLGPLPAKSMKLGLHSFREYGPQQIQVECIFREGIFLFAIDLLPEGRPETLEEISVLSFTPAQPTFFWRYFARSPFQAGYRYRIHQVDDQSPSEWSSIQSHFAVLKLIVNSLDH